MSEQDHRSCSIEEVVQKLRVHPLIRLDLQINLFEYL